MIIAKKNTAYYLSFPAIDSTSPESYKSGVSPVNTAYYKDGAGAWTSLAITDTAAEIGSTGVYEIDLTAAEMNHDKVIIKFAVSGMADDAYQFDLKTMDDVADVVWDETQAGHTTNGTFGKTIKGISEGWVSAEGAVDDGSPTTTSFDTNLTNSNDSFYADQVLTFITGTLAGQGRVISAYDGTTKVVTVDEAFTLAPADTDTFIILAGHVHAKTEIAEAVRAEVDSNSTQLAAILEDTDTTLPALLATIGGIVDLILADTETDGVVLSSATQQAIADALLDRDRSVGADSGSTTVRTVRQALRFLRNAWSISGTTLTVNKEDDSTASWTGTVTTDAAADPVTGNNPAGGA